MDIALIVFGLAFFLVWIILGPVVDLFDAVMKRRAKAQFRKAQHDIDLQQPVGMDRHRILDDFFKGLR